MSGRGRGFSPQPGQQKQRKPGLSKDVLTRIADETLKAIERGSYSLSDKDSATVFDLQSNVQSLKANTTYYGPDSATATWAQSRPQVSSNAQRSMKIWAVEKSTLETSRWFVDKLASESQAAENIVASATLDSRTHAVGVLNFASARNPGGGFKTGARAQEESIARSSTLYTSLTCPIGQQFYTYHHFITNRKNDGYYSHAMIYSPSVMVFRNDAGGWVRPFEIDILTSPAVNAGVVRQKRQMAIDQGKQVLYSEADMESRIRATMKERMARLLYLFESQGVKNLVLGSFGTGAFKNKVDMVVDLWTELLLGEDARFGKSFDRVVFGVIDNATFVKFAEKFGTEAE